MKYKYSALLLALSMLLGACASVPVATDVKSLPKNSEVLIGEYGYWQRDCSNRHFDILIERYPQGGDLRFEVGSLMIPEDPAIGSAGACAGQQVQSKKVIYVAHPNFVGQDSISYVVKSSFLLGSKAYDVNIDVR